MPIVPELLRRSVAPPRRTGPRSGGGAAAGLALLALLGCAAGAAGAKSAADAGRVPPEVRILDSLTFEPKHLVVRVGDTVVWHNESLLVHTVTADPKVAARPEDVALPEGAAPFDSGFLAPKATFRHTFDRPGTYRYFCIPHEGAGMIATVEVEPAS